MAAIPEVVSPPDGGPAVVRFHLDEPANGTEESRTVRALKEFRLRTAKRQENEEMVRCWAEEIAFPDGFESSDEDDGWDGCSLLPGSHTELQG